jgi:hypothetical protein
LKYKWNANGSLKEVTRWVWDGNAPLHEWTYDEKDRPKIVTDEFGLSHKEGEEPTDNITTWVFEEGRFRPAAKLMEDKKGSPAKTCVCIRKAKKLSQKFIFFLFFCNLFYNDIILRKIRVAERVAEGLQKDDSYF